MRTKVKQIAFWGILSATSAMNAQVEPSTRATQLYSHGTCATTVMAPFGAAFIIDNRITQSNENGVIVSQSEGCKVILGRPTILLAGVGLEDTTGISGHWNSLDEAVKALEHLPENPTEEQLDRWGYDWGQSLWQHFRDAGQIPPIDKKVSEILLITKIGNEPYFHRTTVMWSGSKFGVSIAGQNLNKQHPYVSYSGACRDFVNHSSDEGMSMVEAKYRNFLEQQEMSEIGTTMKAATTVDQLATAAYGLENVLTQIDIRLEGDRAVIAPPYATAEWNEGSNGWTTHFNSKCNLVSPPKTTSTEPKTAPDEAMSYKPESTDQISDPSQKKKKSFFRRILGGKD
jgi:hypothetical protein